MLSSNWPNRFFSYWVKTRHSLLRQQGKETNNMMRLEDIMDLNTTIASGSIKIQWHPVMYFLSVRLHFCHTIKRYWLWKCNVTIRLPQIWQSWISFFFRNLSGINKVMVLSILKYPTLTPESWQSSFNWCSFFADSSSNVWYYESILTQYSLYSNYLRIHNLAIFCL